MKIACWDKPVSKLKMAISLFNHLLRIERSSSQDRQQKTKVFAKWEQNIEQSRKSHQPNHAEK